MSVPAIVEPHNQALVGDPLTSLFINYKWRRLVADLLVPLTYPGSWSGSQADVDASVYNAYNLIDDLYSVEVIAGMRNVSMVYTDYGSGNVSGTNVIGWQQRYLATVQNYGSAFLSSYSFYEWNVEPGTYLVTALAQAHRVSRSRLRLYDTVAASPLVYGNSSYVPVSTGGSPAVTVTLSGVVTVATATRHSLEQYCEAIQINTAFGVATNLPGIIERYVSVTYDKLD